MVVAVNGGDAGQMVAGNGQLKPDFGVFSTAAAKGPATLE